MRDLTRANNRQKTGVDAMFSCDSQHVTDTEARCCQQDWSR